MTEGYRALREGAAVFDLSSRGKIQVRGEDRVRLLHAITTNHVEQLGPGQGCYAFFLNPQGRILADVNLFRLPDHLLLDTEPETREKILRHIDKYVIADDVTLEDVTSRIATIAVEGPKAEALLRKLGGTVPAEPYHTREWNACRIARLSATGAAGYWIFAPAGEKADLLARLAAAGAVTASPEAIRILRLENGRPRYGEDFSEDYIPHETQLLGAVHFDKGCYIGQEIVERVRSRGHVNRLLVQLRLDAAEAPAAGTPLEADGSEVGKITSAARSPALGRVAALGYVRTRWAREGAKLQAAGAPVTVWASRPG